MLSVADLGGGGGGGGCNPPKRSQARPALATHAIARSAGTRPAQLMRMRVRVIRDVYAIAARASVLRQLIYTTCNYFWKIPKYFRPQLQL